ncbi:N-acetyltransferase [Phenylobacterium sp.]|uniref:GNAT family N-acetyltransferase n=1 Tax=Phenylobacterium sp. TaxID=1871053 RepID=UPI000C8C794E|nr:GNAT family N-acetyltransferase [Phenylobacterium sp.]MAK81558.1 GNAT family N-acetyltransferase [Phenylobacterium sp.]|tara:strand:- start:107437 stop:107874 length:438 start_codon:yes stop_codon:yes gene_type:complete
MAIVIHGVTAENADLLAKVADDVFDEDITPDRLGPFLAAAGHVMFVAVEADLVVGQIRGMVHVQPDRASDLYIDNLGVAPSHKRRGIGRQLIAALVRWGEAQGCTYAWLATESDNDEAISFYESLKFERNQLEWFASAIGEGVGD